MIFLLQRERMLWQVGSFYIQQKTHLTSFFLTKLMVVYGKFNGIKTKRIGVFGGFGNHLLFF